MQFTWSHVVFFLLGTGIGAVAGRFMLHLLGRSADGIEGQIERAALVEQVKAAGENISGYKLRLATAEEQSRVLQSDFKKVAADRTQYEERASRVPGLELKLSELGAENTNLKTAAAQLGATLDTERNNIQESRNQLINQFEALANKIFDEKSTKLTDQNRTQLELLLVPLKQQLTDFKSKVEDVYVKEGQDRSALAEQVKQLMNLNSTLSADAQNLALAIKGDSKTQGDWGEVILEDALQRAGLVAGQHYEVQTCVTTEDGQSRQIPDVVVRLPGSRFIIIDSKMTLPHYRAFAGADTDPERAAALHSHLASVRRHIKGLSEKNYQTLFDGQTLDFVFMFVPLEPAFTLAMTHDRELCHEAWEKNVILVSPSTLLFVLRTVANLWRQESINRNAKEISKRGAALYEKLVGFVEDLKEVGDRLTQAQRSYDDARKKLSDGPGNAIRQAEKLKELGVKPTKSLPTDWIGAETDEGAAANEDVLPGISAA